MRSLFKKEKKMPVKKKTIIDHIDSYESNKALVEALGKAIADAKDSYNTAEKEIMDRLEKLPSRNFVCRDRMYRLTLPAKGRYDYGMGTYDIEESLVVTEMNYEEE